MKFCTACGAAVDGAVGTQGVSRDDKTEAIGATSAYDPLSGDTVAANSVPGTADPGVQPPNPIQRDDDSDKRSTRPRKKARAIVIGVACAVLVLAIAGASVWYFVLAPNASVSAEEDASVELVDTEEGGSDEETTGTATALSLQVSSLDFTSYPQVVIDLAVSDLDDEDLSAFAALTTADVQVSEDVSSTSYTATVDRVTPASDGSSLRIVYTSTVSDSASRTIYVSFDDLSGFSGSVSTLYEFDEAESTSSSDSTADSASDDYILPDSSTYRYSASELAGYSNWELYIARNEIYARRGRMFNNEDLQEYFGSKSWYTPLYSAEYFDTHMSLSAIESANVQTILSVEKQRGSSYV